MLLYYTTIIGFTVSVPARLHGLDSNGDNVLPSILEPQLARRDGSNATCRRYIAGETLPTTTPASSRKRTHELEHDEHKNTVSFVPQT